MDPDGELIGEPPINVYCIFDEGDGAITLIHNLNEDTIPVDHCDSLQCFEELSFLTESHLLTIFLKYKA